MTERTKHLLSLLGVVVSIGGFYAGNASSFPLLQTFLAPSYASARRGIERIHKDGFLQAGQPGFAALAELVESRVASQNPRVPRSAIALEKLEATGGGIALGAAASRQVIGLKMTFRGQTQSLQWDLLELGEAVEDIWKTKSLRWALWLFWLGVAQTVWPLWLDLKPRQSPPKPLQAVPGDAVADPPVEKERAAEQGDAADGAQLPSRTAGEPRS